VKARVAVTTLGCRLNQVESQEMMALLEQDGFRVVAADEAAEAYVVNTCTVTGKADCSDRQTIRRLRRERPAARLVVTGCWAQTDAGAVTRLGGVDLVIGNQEKYRLPELLGRLLATDSADASGEQRTPEVQVGAVAAARGVPRAPVTRVTGRSRAFVKIQDGCQHRCAFCIVPAARGPSRSQDPTVVMEQVQTLVGAGHREVTLTGVDMGHYGWDLVPRTTLAALIERLAEVPDLRWLRLSSLLPAYVTDDLLEVVSGSPVVAPHLHVPLQSGSDRMLRVMRRPYNVRMYRGLVERLAAAIPDLGLGADMIVGHPGESDGDFDETLGLVSALPFSYLHVFAYSGRQGTESARMGAPVPTAIARERSRRLRALAAEKSLAWRRGLLGRRMEVVVLDSRDGATGRLAGLTGNYLEVLFEGPDGLGRTLQEVTVTECLPGRTLGRRAPAA
jgi:threonylcarbamoyladenosine tRNA methylthiotransferase MtaB